MFGKVSSALYNKDFLVHCSTQHAHKEYGHAHSPAISQYEHCHSVKHIFSSFLFLLDNHQIACPWPHSCTMILLYHVNVYI